MQQMKLKWLLREVSAHINHATLRAAVFGSGCASAALALGAGGGGDASGCLVLGGDASFCSSASVQG